MTRILLSAGDENSADQLDLNEGEQYLVQAGTFRAPVVTRANIGVSPPARTETLLAAGLRPLTLDMSFSGDDTDMLMDLMRAVERKLRQARDASGPYGVGTPVALCYQYGEASEWIYFDVIEGYLEYSDPTGNDSLTYDGTLHLFCLPYARGKQVVIPVSAPIHSGRPGTLYVPDVLGDVDALVELEVTDLSSGAPINSLRIARLSASTLAADAFDPIQPFSASPGATPTAEPDSITGTVAQRTLVHGADWTDVATLRNAAGGIGGLYDLWVRLKDGLAIPTAPTAFSATPVTAGGTLPYAQTYKVWVTSINGASVESGATGPVTISGGLADPAKVRETWEAAISPAVWTLLQPAHIGRTNSGPLTGTWSLSASADSTLGHADVSEDFEGTLANWTQTAQVRSGSIAQISSGALAGSKSLQAYSRWPYYASIEDRVPTTTIDAAVWPSTAATTGASIVATATGAIDAPNSIVSAISGTTAIAHHAQAKSVEVDGYFTWSRFKLQVTTSTPFPTAPEHVYVFAVGDTNVIANLGNTGAGVWAGIYYGDQGYRLAARAPSGATQDVPFFTGKDLTAGTVYDLTLFVDSSGGEHHIWVVRVDNTTGIPEQIALIRFTAQTATRTAYAFRYAGLSIPMATGGNSTPSCAYDRLGLGFSDTQDGWQSPSGGYHRPRAYYTHNTAIASTQTRLHLQCKIRIDEAPYAAAYTGDVIMFAWISANTPATDAFGTDTDEYYIDDATKFMGIGWVDGQYCLMSTVDKTPNIPLPVQFVVGTTYTVDLILDLRPDIRGSTYSAVLYATVSGLTCRAVRQISTFTTAYAGVGLAHFNRIFAANQRSQTGCKVTIDDVSWGSRSDDDEVVAIAPPSGAGTFSSAALSTQIKITSVTAPPAAGSITFSTDELPAGYELGTDSRYLWLVTLGGQTPWPLIQFGVWPTTPVVGLVLDGATYKLALLEYDSYTGASALTLATLSTQPVTGTTYTLELRLDMRASPTLASCYLAGSLVASVTGSGVSQVYAKNAYMTLGARIWRTYPAAAAVAALFDSSYLALSSSAAAAITLATIPSAAGEIVGAWTPDGTAANHRVYWQRDNNAIQYKATGSALGAYTLTTESGGTVGTPPAAPDTTPAAIRASIGAPGDSSSRIVTAGVYPSTADLGNYIMLYLGVVALPPSPATLQGVTPPWELRIQAKPGSNNDLLIDVDGAWLLPHQEAQIVATVPAASPITVPALWRIGTRADGYSYAQLEAGGTVIALVPITGQFTLAPGDNLLIFMPVGAGNIAALAAVAATVKLYITPRYAYLRGAP